MNISFTDFRKQVIAVRCITIPETKRYYKDYLESGLSIEDYLANQMNPQGYISMKDFAQKIGVTNTMELARKLKVQKAPVKDFLPGIYIDKEYAFSELALLNKEQTFSSVFQTECTKLSWIPVNQYVHMKNCLHFMQKSMGYVFPFSESLNQELVPKKYTKLPDQISIWISAQIPTTDSKMSEYITLSELHQQIPGFLAAYMQGKISMEAIVEPPYIYFRVNDVWLKRYRRLCPLKKLVVSCTQNKMSFSEERAELDDALKTEDCFFDQWGNPSQTGILYYDKMQEDEVNALIKHHIQALRWYDAKLKASYMKIDFKILCQHLPIVTKDTRYYIRNIDVLNTLAQQESYIDIMALAAELAQQGSLFDVRYECQRKDLYLFWDGNDNFGIPTFTKEIIWMKKAISAESFFIADEYQDDAASAMDLWLKTYKHPYPEKYRELRNTVGTKLLPQTCNLFDQYLKANQIPVDFSIWSLLDFILAHLPQEIIDITDEELTDFIETMCQQISVISGKYFLGFLKYLHNIPGKSIIKSKSEFILKPRKPFYSNNRAYSIETFFILNYCIFNDEYRESQRLIKLAADDAQFSNLWIYLAFHCICAIRNSDIILLPHPELPEDADVVLMKMSSNQYSNSDYIKVAESFQFYMDYLARTPHKTQHYQNVPDIKVTIPQSAKLPIGIMMMAQEAHFQLSAYSSFIRPCKSITLIRKYFPQQLVRALGDRDFRSRSANKAYLQGIQYVADINNKGIKSKGYILAALARSHKGGFGSLPDVTTKYLNDGNFLAYNAEFIAKQLFERGVCSFIPHLLLEALYGSDYSKLDLTSQTTLIKSTGIHPAILEDTISTVIQNKKQAVTIIRESLHDREHLLLTLQNIVSGAAVSKEAHSLCLAAAATGGCHYPDRSNCLGCRYEILTRSCLEHLLKEYARLMQTMADKRIARRNQEILKTAIIPSIAEIYSFFKLYHEDITEIDNLMRRVIESNARS